jgi:hypothetical protein
MSEKAAPKDQNKANNDQQSRNPGREEPRVDPEPGVNRIGGDIGNHQRRDRDRDQYGAQCDVRHPASCTSIEPSIVIAKSLRRHSYYP